MPGKSRRSGVLLFLGPMAVEAPSLAARRRQQRDVNAFGGVLGERAAHPEGFVIGMGEYGHHSWRVHLAHLLRDHSFRVLCRYDQTRSAAAVGTPEKGQQVGFEGGSPGRVKRRERLVIGP